jgi:hypothetical protein
MVDKRAKERGEQRGGMKVSEAMRVAKVARLVGEGKVWTALGTFWELLLG